MSLLQFKLKQQIKGKGNILHAFELFLCLFDIFLIWAIYLHVSKNLNKLTYLI